MRRLKRWRRPAFSLVEVVASIFLVGTLLVAMLVAHRRAAAQSQLAQRRVSAIEVLDALLVARQAPDAHELHAARGKAPGANPFYFRSTLRSDPALEAWELGVLRVEVFDPAWREGETLASVEMLAEGSAGGGPP